MENKTGKYFKYAMGEIFLVVIGILIALSINNWNEKRKENNYLQMVFAQVQTDLRTDLVNITDYIDYYSERNQRLKDIIERNIPASYYESINESNYDSCEKCVSDISGASPFLNLEKGYHLLKSLNTHQNLKMDSLSIKIHTFYFETSSQLIDMKKILLDLAEEPLVEYQKYDWFVEWSDLKNRKYNKEFITYIFESEEYRKKSARHLIYSGYYLSLLNNYKDKATEVLKHLDENIKK